MPGVQQEVAAIEELARIGEIDRKQVRVDTAQPGVQIAEGCAQPAHVLCRPVRDHIHILGRPDVSVDLHGGPTDQHVFDGVSGKRGEDLQRVERPTAGVLHAPSPLLRRDPRPACSS